MGHHYGIPGLSKSVGGAVERGAIPSLLKFYFNGTLGTTSAQASTIINTALEGAVSASFMTTDSSAARGLIGNDADDTTLAITTAIITQTLQGSATVTTLAPVDGVESEFSYDWPVAGDGKVTLDGSSEPATQGVTDATTGLFIGRDSTTPFMGAIWDVKIYSDAAQTDVIHHWPMNEGNGTIFYDIVGGDDITFSSDLGVWAPLNVVTNAGLPVFNNGQPVTI